MSATFDFFPWLRSGVTGTIRNPALVAELAVSVEVAFTDAVEPARVPVRVRGPADVTGIERSAIVRMVPRANSNNFEPNLFPAIEFVRPDAPWLFTPAGVTDNAGGLAPWIVLVVVAIQDGVSLREGQEGLPAVLTIAAPATPAHELPDLVESWAWAHAQVASPSAIDDAMVEGILVKGQGRTLSRLLCPRRLEPNQRYLACVVPAWSTGVAAGLGRPMPAIAPAWSWPPPPSIDLPVYVHWEFATGDLGDFASLAAGLAEHARSADHSVPSKLGRRSMDISDPGLGLTTLPGVAVELEGAIESVGSVPEALDAATHDVYDRELASLLELTTSVTTPTIGPPIYGASHVPAAGAEPAWVRDLALDPRNRAAAGLGAEVVLANQEQLAAEAWLRLGEIERVEALLERTQLADLVGSRLLAKHVAPTPVGTLLQLTRPAHARTALLTTGARRTVSASVTGSRIAETATASFRRLTRPEGALARRSGATAATVVNKLDAKVIDAAPAHVAPEGTAVIDEISAGTEYPRFERLTANAIATSASSWRDSIVHRPPRPHMALRRAVLDGIAIPDLPDVFDPGIDPKPTIDAFAAASAAHQHYLIDVLGALPRKRPRPPLFPMLSGDAITSALAPRVALLRAIRARAPGLAIDPAAPDPFGPRRHVVEFEDAAFERLRALSPDAILPGLADVAPESAMLLQSNRRFIEAFMVGLNQSLGAELAWRRFPAERVGTFVRSFWKAGLADIPRHGDAAWNTGGLGQHAMRGEPVMFLLRGKLVERYPNAIVTAIPAKLGSNGRSPSDSVEPITPVFKVSIGPDILIVAFELGVVDRDALRGRAGDPDAPGWYFVIQEHPTEPRFGLDATPAAGSDPSIMTSWRQLGWGHFVDDDAGLAALAYLPLQGRVASRAPAAEGATWGRNAGEMAFITLRRPTSVAFHASTLL